MALDYDFFINDLGFNLATSKNRPYERATAQFRKDQLDAASNPGDQSLTGWWTRGQQSFHHGAGVLYYEVQDGETVLNRFDSALGVNPFIPGEVSLGGGFDEQRTTGAAFVDGVYFTQFIGGNRLVLLGDNNLAYQLTTGTPLSSQTLARIVTTGTGPVNAIAAGRFKVFLAVGKNVEVWDSTMTNSTVLWTGTGGFNIVNLWYAKQRLWVVDENGNWYVLAANSGGSFAEADAKFTIKDYKWLVTTSQTWSLAESPGPVYIGAFNEVYSVSVDVDSSTLLPTIGAPALVAELPGDETIYCLGWAVGTLAIATGHGARFAIPNGDGLAYGPALSNGQFVNLRRMAARGTRISMPGYFFNEVGLWSFDLGNMVDTLQPAHVLEVYMPSGSDQLGKTGVTNTPNGLVMWSQSRSRVYRATGIGTLASPGSIKTGFHRFGTLDPKMFRSVLVRIGGTGGSVDVYRRDADFTETLLGTVTYPATQAELPLGLTSATERVALRFVLNADAVDNTKGPKLLGYQLKALPSPKRQRMIRVPLMLFDGETNRRGQVMHADPWDRLSALEALEQSNAVVTFSDNETGETGTAFIEAIEVSRETPPGAGNGSVGGFIYVTLRRVD